MQSRLVRHAQHLTASAVVCLLVGVSTVATAHDVPEDGVEPAGIDTGGLRLHPGAFLHSTYDTNLFYNDEEEEQDNGEQTGAFSIRPGLSFRVVTPDPGVADWTLDARGSWEQYISAADRVLERSGVEATFDTAVRLFPKSLVAVTPHFSYTRTNGPADEALERDFDQHLFTPGLDVEIQPRGGAVFSERLGYDLRVQLYDDIDDLTKFDHRIRSATRWNFLPQTAIHLLLEQHIVTYPEEERDPFLPDRFGEPFSLQLADSYPFRGTIGVQGLILRRLSASLHLGYGYTGYERGPNGHIWLLRTEVGYKFLNGAALTAGYLHNFQDSSFGNFFEYHQGQIRFNGTFLDRFAVDLGTRVQGRLFSPVERANTDETLQRNDIVFEVDVEAGYYFVPGLKLSLAYLLRGNESDFEVVTSAAGIGPIETNADYIKHVVSLVLAYEL